MEEAKDEVPALDKKPVGELIKEAKELRDKGIGPWDKKPDDLTFKTLI